MFYDAQHHPYAQLFEENAGAIRDELHALDARVLDLHRKAEPLEEYVVRLERGENGWTRSWQAGTDAPNPHWLTYALWYSGRCAKGAREKLPVTTTLIAGVPGCKVAAFSLMRPQSVIGAHRHPELRGSPVRIFHLGLDVAPGRSFLCVGGEFRPELPGRSLMFDGSAEHFAVNANDADRIILYAEFDVSAW